MLIIVSKVKNCPYDNLMAQVNSYKLTNTDFDPTEHKIDDFMVDAYMVYVKYNSVVDKIDDVFEMIKKDTSNDMLSGLLKLFGVDNIDDNDIKKELDTISTTFEDLLLNCDFEGVQIRGIQKNFLKDKLKEAIENEEYMLCAKLRDKINSI